MIKKINNDKFICTDPNFIIITFDEIFEKVVLYVINIIYNIHGNLELIKILNTDIKKIFIHAILEQIYKRLLEEVDNNYVLYINTKFKNSTSEIWTYADKSILTDFIIKICKDIARNTPLPIYVDTTEIDLQKYNGETKEIVNKLSLTIHKFENNILTSKSIKKYSKSKGLIHFIQKYHSEDNIKNSMFYTKYIKGAKYE